MLSALAFNIIPTIFEVGLVTGVLVRSCHLIGHSLYFITANSFTHSCGLAVIDLRHFNNIC